MGKRIEEQASKEVTGVPVESVTISFQDEPPITIKGGQASVILDPADSYKYITIENKSLDTARSANV